MWTWLALPQGQPALPLVQNWLVSLGVANADAPPAMLRGAHGRPRLQPPHDAWDCNWSHSGGGLLVAAARELRIGADVEITRPLPRALEIAKKFFAPAESDWLATLDPAAQQHGFVRLWCAKEAVLKAHGRGIWFGLHRLRFVLSGDRLHLSACDPELGHPDDWQVQEFSPATGFHAALAWRRPWTGATS